MYSMSRVCMDILRCDTTNVVLVGTRHKEVMWKTSAPGTTFFLGFPLSLRVFLGRFEAVPVALVLTGVVAESKLMTLNSC